MFLDRRGEVTHFLPFGDSMRLAIRFEPEIPQPAFVEFAMRLGLNEVRESLSGVDWLHARLPFKICAIWMKRMSRPRRSAQPFWCIRHDMSAETMYSAPAR